MRRLLPCTLAMLLLGTVMLTRQKGEAATRWWLAFRAAQQQLLEQPQFSVLPLATGPVGSLAVDPHDPHSLYLGGTEGLFFSTDGGAHWSLLSRELRYPHVLLVDPHDPNRLYAALRDFATFLPRPGVYRSSNGGLTWERLTDGLGEERVFSLALDPLQRDTLYVGGWAGRIYRSLDGGAHWERVSAQPMRACPRCAPGTVGQLLVSPVDGALYAVGDYSGTFRSTDGGTSWTLLNGDSGQVAVDPLRGDLYLAGRRLQRSSDGGQSWEDLSAGLPYDPRAGTYATFWIAVHSDPLVLYTRYYRSLDGGTTWERLQTPLTFIPRMLLPGVQPSIYGSVSGQAGRYDDVLAAAP